MITNIKRMFSIFLLLSLTYILSSCLTVTKKVRYMKPAEITISQNIKTIALLPAGRYKRQIYDVLISVFGDEAVKARFDVIDRQNLDKILQEQNLYNSDDFNDNTAVELGQLSGAQAVIVGAYKNARARTTKGSVVLQRRYLIGYKKVDGKKIPKYAYKNESVRSKIKTYNFSIDVRMLDIETGELLHNENNSYKEEYEMFNDKKPDKTISVVKRNAPQVSVFPDIIELFEKYGKKFVSYFAKKVAPYYVLEDMDFEKIARDDINKRFIKLIKNDLYEEALELMTENMDRIKIIEKSKFRSKHYYNLGCIYELKNDFVNSQMFYKKGVNEDPTKLHLIALKAIRGRIEDKQKLDEQIQDRDLDPNEEW